MMVLILMVGIFQSWNIALSIFNLCLISAVMTMGANIQWGYAGLINFGIMGYTALGGLAAVLISRSCSRSLEGRGFRYSNVIMADSSNGISYKVYFKKI